MEIPQEMPYDIKFDQQVGRFLVASRDINPLEIILIDIPSVVGPNHKTPMVCLECLQYIDGCFLCPGCGYPMCSEICCHGSIHVQECQLLEKVKNDELCHDDSDELQHNHINYKLIMTLRIFLLKAEESIIWNGIGKLIDHQKERKENISEWNMFQTTVVDVIKKIFPEARDDELHNIIGIICINAVGFDFQKERIKGRALYPHLSIISHSCMSNTRYNVSPTDFSVVVRARQFIEAGTEITINYVPSIFGMPKRKQHIFEEWYFECRCPRCLDNTEFGTYTSALKCSQCREGLILPYSNKKDDLWRCRNCNLPFDLEFISNYVRTIEDQLNPLFKADPTAQKLEEFIKGHFNDLHPKHYINLIVQRNLIQVLDKDPQPTRETLNKLIKYCKRFKATMSRLDPGYSEWMGFVLKKMNTATLTLLKFDLQVPKWGSHKLKV